MPRCSVEDLKKKKDKITRRSPSVAEIKTEIRKQFKERLRSVRDNMLDKKRILFEENHYNELKENLMQSYDYPEDTDLLIAFAEIEEEIRKDLEAQEHQNYLENIANSYLINLQGKCSVCDTLIVTNDYETDVICSLCAKNYFNSEKL